MSLFRKILMTLMVISGIGSTISAGTFASYNASTTNPTSTFATGSLVLDRKVGATSCFSVGAGTNTDTNANTACGVVINQDRVKLGDTFTVDLTLTNAGTIGGTLSLGALDADGVTAGHQVCASTANNVLNWTAGTGNLCANTGVFVQEYTPTFAGAPLPSCAYPVLGSSCAASTATTLSANAAAPHPILAATSGLPSSAAPQSLGAIAAGQSRYFRLSFNLLAGADNQLQGRRATFALSWTLQ